MKESFKEYLEYLDSDEELEYYIRINATWNEGSFERLKTLLKEMETDYAADMYYPRPLISFYVKGVDRIVGVVTNPLFLNNPDAGYTKESYAVMILQRAAELRALKERFLSTL